MRSTTNPSSKIKYLTIALLTAAFTICGLKAFSQPSQTPPPPPPSPAEVFNKINPFKKNKKVKDTAVKKDTAKLAPAARRPAGPPPPPNPMNFFKKKKKDTVKAATTLVTSL